jgi:hypothetical protein
MKRFLLLILAIVFLAQAGCGGAGGGGGGGGVTTISGTASKGIIKNGTVRIYAINADGSRGSLLAETNTDNGGIYRKEIGKYSGPVIAYAFGSYTDEATGATVTLTESNALRAALPAASGVVTLPITAFTEVAVRKAGAALTPSAITDANALVSTMFKVDITGSNPVEASAAALSDAAVTAEQLHYTVALAGLSQMAQECIGNTASEKLEDALKDLTDGIATGTMATATAQLYTDSVSKYLDDNVAINTLVANHGGCPIITVGSKNGYIVLSLAGATSAVFGANLTLTLPAGVTVNAKTDGTASSGAIGFTTSTKGAFAVGAFTRASGSSKATLALTLISSGAVANGDFLIINANVTPGTVITKDSFSITGTSVVDQNGALMAGSLSVGGVTVK